MATTQDLKNWLVEKYHDYDLDPEPLHGTYGLIWFLKSKHANSYSDTIALKTLAPERLNDLETQEDITYLRKEFEMWLNLPDHRNVVQATRFDTAHLTSGDQKKGMISLPVMLMPRMTGSLQEWVDNSAFSMEDRLIALAQSLNGLLHLYKHKFEGHGDLKPSNILYRNERTRLVLDDRKAWPSLAHPWIIKIADLGWANAWIHFGFTNKAQRQYLAPERLKGKFIPCKSDMFSMGIIAAELLQGRHPAPNLKKALSSGEKWDRCVEKKEWKLDGIICHRLQKLILKCLAYHHEDRPTPEECLSEICAELRETYDQDIGPTLQLWNERKLPAISVYQRAAWVALQASDLGGQEAKRSRENIEQLIKGIIVLGLESCEEWLTLALALFELLKREGPDSAAQINQLRDSAKMYMKTVFGNIDRHRLESVAPRGDWSTTTNTSVQPFERFSYAIRDTAHIAGVTYESEAVGAAALGPLALAVFAYSAASDAFSGNGKSNLEYFLAEAIRHAPEQAVPYFYRARWRWNRWTASSSTMKPNAEDLAPWVADLEIAIRLSPTWEAPRSFLQYLQSAHHTAQ